MEDTTHRTAIVCVYKKVVCGKQKTHWLEFQLLDEQGEPLANMPFRAHNQATREDYIPEFSGRSDAEGVIRLEGLHPLAVTLLLAADPLAEVLQTRRLRGVRAEPHRPIIGDRTPLYSPQRPGFSPIEAQALAAGHGYQYLRIGQLCDRLPSFDPPLPDPEQPPAYHFPDLDFAGFTVSYPELNRRYVLELCPLRAWSLVLHHQQSYSLANAYNLGLMSILAYSKWPETEVGSVEEFFEQQCLDLSRTPRVWDNGQAWPSLVADVPFDERYIIFKTLDTSKAKPPEGDTQLFYAIGAAQVLVAWRGTEMEWPLPDIVTDVTFRPVKPVVPASCEPKAPCPDLTPDGSVHLGFRDAFDVARRIYDEELGKTIPDRASDRKLFICGHSLGGALGLIHATTLKSMNPLLYTYGMPRTFTLKAIHGLSELWHFRHVNDLDTIPAVPPEAELDNYFYELYGPLGSTLGFTWSLLQLTASNVVKFGDPFAHHGELATFLKCQQHVESRGSNYRAQFNKEGLGAPYYTMVLTRLTHALKLYLVPSLHEEASEEAEQAQGRLTKAVSVETRERLFPRHRNVRQGVRIKLGDHFMSQYQPYIHNQLLESIRPLRVPPLERQEHRKLFVDQYEENRSSIPEDERRRTELFLSMHSQIDRALRVTQETEGGPEALERFDAVGDPRAYYENHYG